jgi:FHS family L-fucose permease-like MFS transporter
MNNNKPWRKALPVLFGFFVMGFVDLIGISTNYVKQDFALSDTVANLCGMSLFLWFAILSVPTALVMNKIGRKRTVIISMFISLLAMVLPLLHYSFTMMLAAFALLGIGNTIIQVSINPLISDVVTESKLTSALTLGQFIKAIAAFLGPIIAVTAMAHFGNWKLLFLVYGIITIISMLWLQLTPIKEADVTQPSSSVRNSLSILKDKRILWLFIGIIFVVGIDVGLNTTIPKYLIERCGIPLEKAGLGTSLYFVARTIGTLFGAILLVKISAKKFFKWSMILAIPFMTLMLLLQNMWSILIMIFLVGFAVANVFSIIFSTALQERPDKSNEISGLMIMGVVGGAIIPFCMGIISDKINQTAAMGFLLIMFVYLLICAIRIPNKVNSIQ